jgi:hypothetical protein
VSPQNDDTLPAIWMSDQPVDRESVMTAVDAVLREDRAEHDKERRIRMAFVIVLALFCPVLVWCAAHGITPLVRGGYALMTVGAAILVYAEWTYLEWFRQARPGPADARTQLQRTAFLVSRQANLLRTTPLWSAPVFIGTAMIGLWLYQQRSQVGGSLLWAGLGAGWVLMVAGGLWKGRALDRRRSRMEQLLNDL